MDYRKEALKHITAHKHAAEAAARENLAAALKDSEFAKLHNEKMTYVIESAKKGVAADVSKFEIRLKARQKELNVGSIEPEYNCTKCSDSGYIDGQICECLKRQQNMLQIQNSGFGQLHNFTDVHFDIFEKASEMQKIYSLMKSWCHSDFKKNIVYLSGYTGTGKTYLTQCMANELINLGKDVMAVSAFKLSQDILRGFASKDMDEKDSIMKRYYQSSILFIDDLGTEQGANATQNSILQSGLYYIINERKNNHLPIVITTNLDLSDLLATYDERITSRIADDTTIKLQLIGKDLRFKGKI